MNEPSIRNVALLPVVAVVAGGVFALSTVVGQNVPDVQDCGPGAHSMAMGAKGMGGMDHGSSSGGGMDMGGMDHSAHMAMGGSSGGCMGDDTMQRGGTSAGIESPDTPNRTTSTEEDSMPAMDHAPKTAKQHGSTKRAAHSGH